MDVETTRPEGGEEEELAAPSAENEIQPDTEDDEIEVEIRLMKPEDNNAVTALVYDGIHVFAMNRMVMNNMERPYIVCVIGLIAIFTNWLLGGIILSLLISVLLVPGIIYVFIRFVCLPIYIHRHCADLKMGMDKYWTQPDTGRSLWVAELSGKVIGCVAIETVSPMVTELSHVSIDSEWQCMGIGGKLTDHVIDHVKERRFQECVAKVLNVYQEMANLMNKLGFKKTGSRPAFFKMCEEDSYSLKMPGRSSFSEAETSRSELNG